MAYGILGGIPRYLKAFNPAQDITTNIAEHILSENAYLHDEPQLLLRMELREPGIYNSILEAIANGANKISTIADRIHEDRSKCTKYLQVLQNIRLVKKIIPCGQPKTSKKGIYVIADHYYRFWYRYTFSQKNYYFLLGEEKAAQEIMDGISDYMGPVFEEICTEYLWRQAKAHALPFIPAVIGKWWGTNPLLKQQDDIDILALDKTETEGIFCECKYRNRPMPMEEYDDLVQATAAFPKVTKKHLVFFSKGGYTQPVIERAQREGTHLLGISDLF
ncbi:ATP-binding protein [Megasphaera sp.]|uniref:ATP-binding protein n=1 Tax=Megasphaera sp. TaxID=2023260 RepID=UPI00307FA289